MTIFAGILFAWTVLGVVAAVVVVTLVRIARRREESSSTVRGLAIDDLPWQEAA
jgi:hypothetical protein